MDDKLLETVRRKDSQQRNAFHIAAERGDLPTIQSLVNDLDESSRKENIKGSQSVLGGVLSVLADSYHRAENNTSILTGALLKAEDSRGWQPLHYAARNGHVEVVRFLLSKKSYINAIDQRGHTPLCLAACYGKIEVVNLLLANRAEIKLESHFYSNENEHDTPLHLAALNGHLDILVSLDEHAKKRGYSFINIKNKGGYTAIHMAAFNGHQQIVSYLIQKGAHFNKKNLYRDTDYYAGFPLDTPLMLAAGKGHVEVVRTLLTHNVSVNDFNANGDTALHFACKNQHKEIIRLLLAAGAKKNAKNHQGELALNFVKDREWLHNLLAQDGQQKIERELLLDDANQPHYQYALISIMSSYREGATLKQLKEHELNTHCYREKALVRQYIPFANEDAKFFEKVSAIN